MESRLGDARDVCRIAALVILTPASAPIPCTITDISERGARLVLDVEVELPKRFVLALPLLGEQHDHRPVESRWQRGTMSGVRFLQPRSAVEP